MLDGGSTPHKSGRTRVRIRDIAGELSLSVCTISKILNNRSDVSKYSPDTVARVREAAQRLGYYPNEIAQSLASGRTRTIGLCLADLAAAMFGDFATVFEKGASAQGFMSFICTAGDDAASEAAQVRALLARCVDALVISPIGEKVRDILLENRRRDCRLVLFDRPLPGVVASEVTIDNRAAMCRLATRCLALGHRRIGVISGNPGDHSLAERLAGIEDAAAGKRVSLEIAPGESATTEAGGILGMRQLMASARPPTLVLTLGSTLSLGALMELRTMGLVPGKDVSLAGFDDFPGAALLTPALTVVSQPVRKMAEACLEFACMANGAPPKRRSFKAEVLWRDSVVATR